jgi:hypothetical protein
MCVRLKLTSTSGCGGTELNPSPVRETTSRSRREAQRPGTFRYRVLRAATPRGAPRSVDRKCAGRNASSVKVSSPDRHLTFVVADQVLSREGSIDRRWMIDTTGVQVHGMYTRLMSEPERSLLRRARSASSVQTDWQRVAPKSAPVRLREVRYRHSSDMAGLSYRPREVG